MRSGFAQRFAVEAAFLVLLALAAGFADLKVWQIAAVMGVGWLLVTLIEWLAWRSDRQLEERLETRTPAVDEGEPEQRHGWDVEEILAPLPEDEEEAFTSVLLPEDEES
ncbi:MAG: hypothetical protein C5B48_13460 [Candidatus Rokuibacteriota bacterium]|nr:MAG: hypothetical protein C5B48_13460 [Candidatus Rokubacteria bacterium]